MKLKKLLNLLALLVVGLTLSCAFTACGDDEEDEPKTNKSELIGYWYWEEDGEFEAMSLSEGGSGEYLYGICGNPGSIYTDFITWNDSHVQGVKVLSVNSRQLIQQEEEGGEIIVYNRISAKEWSNLKKTASLDGSNSGEQDTPDNPATPKYQREDFYGIWYDSYDGVVFDFRSGSCDAYYIKSEKDYTYYEKNSGEWAFDSATSELSIYVAAPGSSSPSIHRWTVSDMTASSFKTGSYGWEKRSSLPTLYTPDTPDTPDKPSSLLAGTNWSGTIDGDYVELSFKTNGTFVEIYAGDRSTATYTELDSNTIIIGDGTVMSNTFGENPFHFELSANKSTLTFSNSYDTWKFKRKA